MSENKTFYRILFYDNSITEIKAENYDEYSITVGGKKISRSSPVWAIEETIVDAYYKALRKVEQEADTVLSKYTSLMNQKHKLIELMNNVDSE